MSRPSREKLEEQLHEAQVQVAQLEQEVAGLRKTQQSYAQGLEVGTQIVAMRDGMMDAGMSKEDAMAFIVAGIQASLK